MCRSARMLFLAGVLLAARGAAGAGTPEIDMRIVFPKHQKGVANLTNVRLVPRDGGAHEVSGLASFDKAHNAVKTTFAPRKDVRPGHTYAVFVSDAMGKQYGPVGAIDVKAGSARLAFRINASLIAASEPPPRPATAAPSSGPQAGEGFKRPGADAWQTPGVGQGYVRPGSR